MKNNILVLGGTGKTGRKVAERLTNLTQKVRIGSRSHSPAFDWQDPSGWEAVLEGMDMIYITFQPDLAVPGALEAIEELTRQAKRSNVKKLVLLSGKGEREAELCEQVIIHAGLDYTIVRASWFNQNFSEGAFLDPIVAGHVAMAQAEVEIPFVDTDDIADVVVASLLEEAHSGNIYELTGPRTLTFKQAINEIAIASGREIKFESISLAAYSGMLKELQIPDDYIWLINYLFTEVLGDESVSTVTNDIEKVLGRKANDFLEYVQETVKTGVWNPRVNAQKEEVAG